MFWRSPGQSQSVLLSMALKPQNELERSSPSPSLLSLSPSRFFSLSTSDDSFDILTNATDPDREYEQSRKAFMEGQLLFFLPFSLPNFIRRACTHRPSLLFSSSSQDHDWFVPVHFLFPLIPSFSPFLLSRCLLEFHLVLLELSGSSLFSLHAFPSSPAHSLLLPSSFYDQLSLTSTLKKSRRSRSTSPSRSKRGERGKRVRPRPPISHLLLSSLEPSLEPKESWER